MQQWGQIWLKLKEASKLISVNLSSTESGKESYWHKTNRIWIKKFQVIYNIRQMEQAKHEMINVAVSANVYVWLAYS